MSITYQLATFYKTKLWKSVTASGLIISGVQVEFTRQTKAGDMLLDKGADRKGEL